jgi:tripartite-type tricarboxylate transporter receptor subunit TctC
VGSSPGGGYDAYSRLLARHIGKYIPGNPTIIVQNRRGAKVITANYMWEVAKPNGLTIGIFVRGLFELDLTGDEAAHYEWEKFNWLGSMASELYVMQVRADTGIKTIEDLRNYPEVFRVGERSRGSGAYAFIKLTEKLVGKPFKMVLGYSGSSDIALAMERKEVEAMAGSLTSLLATRPHWVKEGFVNLLIQSGIERSPDLPDVPSHGEFATTEIDKQMVLLVDAPNTAWGRGYVAPPGTPADRVQILRQAFDKALHDPQLLAEAEKLKLPIDFKSGEEVQRLASEVMQVSPEAVAAYRNLNE